MHKYSIRAHDPFKRLKQGAAHSLSRPFSTRLCEVPAYYISDSVLRSTLYDCVAGLYVHEDETPHYGHITGCVFRTAEGNLILNFI